jgi:WD40 repeat protein
MQRLFSSLRPDTFGQTFANVSWNPNGHVLASMPGVSGVNPTGEPMSESVTFYDSTTGRLLGTLRTDLSTRVTANDLSPDGYMGSTSDLVWSADGSHLLVYDDQAGTITIWGPGALPQA